MYYSPFQKTQIFRNSYLQFLSSTLFWVKLSTSQDKYEKST
uniref:Uncharacterized protein n=1 Tax=Arundo donax TaxID=35708 RepID=A0A0A8XY62_ARUDO